MIKSIVYSREFVSSTFEEDVSYHGSPHYENYQEINDLDKQIRKKMEEMFSLKEDEEVYFGFDGKRQYRFEITQSLCYNKGDKKIKYLTRVYIKKASSEDQVDKLCDLEEFLIKNKFAAKKK